MTPVEGGREGGWEVVTPDDGYELKMARNHQLMDWKTEAMKSSLE